MPFAAALQASVRTMSKAQQLIGLDSSFIMRLLIGEPAAQAKKAVAELDKMKSEGRKAAVSDLVASEVYFALQYHYNVPKEHAIKQLHLFLSSPEIVPLGHALSILKQANLSRAKPGFVDRMINAEYIDNTAGMMTFEKAASKLARVTIPE